MSIRVPLLVFACLSFSCDDDPETQSGPDHSVKARPLSSPQTTGPRPTEQKPSATRPRGAYLIAEQTPAEVKQGLKTACEQAKAQAGRILIEFSAPWCGDCRKLAELKQEPILRDKLDAAPYFVVNVGRFDRHEDLLTDFDVRSIARWQVVEATDCAQPPHTWPRVAHRTLEPRTGKKITAHELAEWVDQVVSGS